MAWEDVPAKMAEYRAIEYGGDANADSLLAAFYGWRTNADLSRTYSEEYVPEKLRAEFGDALDHRLEACRNLTKSRAWTPDELRRV